MVDAVVDMFLRFVFETLLATGTALLLSTCRDVGSVGGVRVM